MEIKPIRMAINAGAGTPDDALRSLGAHFGIVAESIRETCLERGIGANGGGDAVALLAVVIDFLAVMPRLDHEYGPDNELPIKDAPETVNEALRALAELESWSIRLGLDDQLHHLHALEIGCGFWAMRHGLPMVAVEPIVNALAARSNAAGSTQETAAVYAMMQGFISHFSSALMADRERSNPQRPWRLLNLNFAITGIRTGDASLMRYAFDTLNSHLPFDLAGFYAEARDLASRPGFPTVPRGIIEAEYLRWTRAH